MRAADAQTGTVNREWNDLSILVPNITNNVLDDLDPRFFTQSFDPVLFLLEECLPKDENFFEQWFEREISALDVGYDSIVKKLMQEVRDRSTSLIEGVNLVQQVDLEVLHTLIHVKNGRRLLNSAKDNIVCSTLSCIRTKQRRDRIELIISYCEDILHCFKSEKRMKQALEDGHFMEAVDLCIDLRSSIKQEHLRDVDIVRNLAGRIEDFCTVLKQQFDASLRKAIKSFDPRSYRELLQGYITLVDQSNTSGLEFSRKDLTEIFSSIPEIVIRLIGQITKAEVSNLLSILQAQLDGEEHCSSDVKSRSQLWRHSDECVTDIKNGNRHTIVSKLINTYGVLTDLLHSYYLLVQWHRDPFNPKNDNLHYLHRCGIDDDDDDDDDNDDDNRDAELSIPPEAESTIETDPKRGKTELEACYYRILCETGMALLRHRKSVWEIMQRLTGKVLECLSTNNSFNLSSIALIASTTTTFLEIGEEFVGTSCAGLRSLVHLKCEQYLSSFHKESMELMRMLMDTESWQRVNGNMAQVRGEEIGNIGLNNWLHRLIEQRSRHSFGDTASSTVPTAHAIHERNAFSSFLTTGNPFYTISDDTAQDMPAKGVESALQRHNVHISARSHLSNLQVQLDYTIDFEELILDTSTLSGFCRLCGTYLKIMESLPQVAWDAFLYLNKLFEYQFFYIFTAFSTEKNMKALFAPRHFPTSETWTELRHFMARLCKEYLGGSSSYEKLCQISVSNEVQQNGTGDKHISLTIHGLAIPPKCIENGDPDKMYGIVERFIACEGLRTQMKIMLAMEPYARSLLGMRHSCLFDETFRRNAIASDQLRDFLYTMAAKSMLDVAAVLQQIWSVQWNKSSIAKFPNDYTISVVRRCGEIWGNLHIIGGGGLPVYVRDQMWSRLVAVVFETLYEGFSNVKRCSRQGRASMCTDLQTIQRGLEVIHHVHHHNTKNARTYIHEYLKSFC